MAQLSAVSAVESIMRLLTRTMSLSVAAILFVFASESMYAAETDAKAKGPMMIGGVKVSTILERLGAKMEEGISPEKLEEYAQHFGVVDKDGDGRHSKVEYIDNGNYLSPQARRGIFKAADNDSDGFVTKAEYSLNRIITDEAKAIMQAMDGDKDGAIQRAEFLKHAAPLLSEARLAESVFAGLDANANGALVMPEYLRVWGQWARDGRKSAAERLAKKETAKRPASGGREGRGRPGSGGRAGGPGGRSTGPVRLNQAGLKVGSALPDLSVFDAEGKAFEMTSLKGKHAVLVFGCLT